MNKLREHGMELFPFLGLSKKEIFVLLRTPKAILRSFAERNNFTMLLDAKEIEAAAKAGDPERNIAPFEIANDETVTNVKPYEYVYSRFTRKVPERLFAVPLGERYADWSVFDSFVQWWFLSQ